MTPTHIDEENKLKLQKMKFENMKLLGEVVKVWMSDFGKFALGIIFVISLVVNGGHMALKFFDKGSFNPKIEMSYAKSAGPELDLVKKEIVVEEAEERYIPQTTPKSRKFIEKRNIGGGAISLVILAFLIMLQIKSRRKKNG